MTSYQPMSAPEPQGYGAPTRGAAPSSIRTSVMIIWALLALFVLSTVFSFVYLDDIIATTLESQQAPGVDEDTIRFAAIATSLFFLVIFGALYVVLAIFLRKGHNWARIVSTVLTIVGALFGLFGLFGPQPALLVVVGVVTLALQAALLYFMWQQDATAFLKPQPTY